MVIEKFQITNPTFRVITSSRFFKPQINNLITLTVVTFNRSSVILTEFFPLKVLVADGTGRTGLTYGDQKCLFIFFILRYIKHNTNVYLNIYTYIQVVRTKFLWVLNFGEVGELPRGFSKSKDYTDFFQKLFPTSPSQQRISET